MIALPSIRYIDWANSVSVGKHLTKGLKMQVDKGMRDNSDTVLWTVNGELKHELLGTDITSDLIFYKDCNITVINTYITDLLGSVNISFIDSIGNNVSVKVPYKQSVKITAFGDFKISVNFADKTSSYIGTFCNTNPILNGGLIDNIDFGVVEYDKEKVSKVFDTFYGCWFINSTYENFATDLQNCYDLNKDNIDNYFKLSTAYNGVPYQEEIYDFGKKTVNDNKGKRTDTSKYGERTTYSNDYNYPINDTMDNSNPSSGNQTKQKEVNGDETTYGEQNNNRTEESYKNTVKRTNNTDPVSNLNANRNITTFYGYFISCFKECFTLFEMMGW